MNTGLVIKSTGSAIGVLTSEGENVDCRIKGNLRIAGIRSTNPVAVGDQVTIERQADGTTWITSVLPRRNYIVRKSTNLSKQSHILAANIDQVALLVTIKHPETSTTFIDRLLATAEAYNVPAMLVFNKVDLLSPEELEELGRLRALYESIGYPTFAISAKYGSIEDLKNEFIGKTTLLSGNSGVGKSTLLNAIFGETVTRTADISQAHDKGMHTTTFSEMYFLDERQKTKDKSCGAIIDTPGVKGFGTIDMQKEEVGHYFREIFAKSRECRYSNCLHCGEPGCAVLPEVGESIAETRFESYLSILSDAGEGKYR
ncbi:MAG: ribosome small subunit-dependent GTPase A [Paludibacteraceae bacterium]|nr:ribosome small subunit-dependent GTPase A [Paludibacteraceae bacterium]